MTSISSLGDNQVQSEKGLSYQLDALPTGVLKFKKKVFDRDLKKYIAYLFDIESDRPGSGFGTLAYRKFLVAAIDLNYPCIQIRTFAIGTSHLFHCYMGMVPARFDDFGMLIEKLVIHYREKRDKIPKDGDFGSFEMFMSPKGLARWKETIEKNIPFVPFKGLESLKPLLQQYIVWREKHRLTDLPLLKEDVLEELIGTLQLIA